MKTELLKKLLELYKKLLALLLQVEPDDTDKSKEIYNYGKKCLRTKISPIYKDYGCVEAIYNVVKGATGKSFKENASTYRLYRELKSDSRYKEINEPKIGDLIISPTGYGNGEIPNGHIGIISDNGKIMNNNSATLLFDEHYTLETWKNRYQKLGGYPVKYFRVLT